MRFLQANFDNSELLAPGFTTFRTPIIALRLPLRRANARNPAKPAIQALAHLGIKGIMRVIILINNAFATSSIFLYPNIFHKYYLIFILN